MARARYHYMTDLFYSDGGGPDGTTKWTGRIIAGTDSEAISEAEAAAIKVPARVAPTRICVRKVFRTREETIFDSAKVPHA